MTVPAVRFGYLPDPVDARDRNLRVRLSATGIQTPFAKVDWRSKVPAILDQRRLGSCVAHGVLGAIRLKHAFMGINSPELGNRLGVYWGARAYIGMQDFDSGSHIRDAFRFINKHGFMPESETDHGYDVNHFRDPPSPAEQRKMFDQRDKGQGQVSYYRIYETGSARRDALKLAMSNDVIPVLGTSTTQEFLNYRGGILPKPSEDDRETGGHAFYLCGYDSDCVYAANSWGDDVGEDGIWRIAWEYIEWSETRDIWGVDEAPYFSHLLEVA